MAPTSGQLVTGFVPSLLFLLAVIASDAWVYMDAKAQDERGTPVVFSAGTFVVNRPAAWFFACLLLWIFFFPLYITRRGRVG